MRARALAVLISLACVASAHANLHWAQDDSAYLDSFDTESLPSGIGVCAVTLQTDRGNSHPSITVPGYWPSSQGCSQLDGRRFGYHTSGPVIQVNYPTLSGFPDMTQRAVMLGMQHTETMNRFTQVGEDRFITANVSPNIYNQYPTTASFPILKASWCGEEFHATFVGSTIVPDTTKLRYSDGDFKCASIYQRVTGKSGASADRAYFTMEHGLANAFTFPLKGICSGYSITIDDNAAASWQVGQTTPFVVSNLQQGTSGPPSEYKVQVTGGSARNMDITISLDSLQRASSIDIYADDGDSGGNGGNAFTITCDGYIDADQDKALCEATRGNQWSQLVNDTAPNPPQACCGDDGTNDVNDTVAGYKCTQTSSGYLWKSPQQLCTYPAGWTIPGVTDLASDAELSYHDPGATLGCCSELSKHHNLVTNSTDQSYCNIQGSAQARWAVASENASIVNISNDTSIPIDLIVSDGSTWHSCNAPTNTVTVVTGTDYPDNRADAGACAAGGNSLTGNILMVPCDPATDPNCFAPGGGGGSGGGGGGSPGSGNPPSQPNAGGTCTAYPNTECGATDRCECSNDAYSWNGNACAAYTSTQANCPSGSTYNPSSHLCEYTSTQSASTIFSNDNTCALVNNSRSGNGKPFICLTDWEPFNASTQYYLDANGGFIRIPPTATHSQQQQLLKNVTQVCSNGRAVQAVKKFSPDFQDIGFCNIDQCYYYGPQKGSSSSGAPSNTCVSAGVWVRDDLCTLDPNTGNASWTARTQLLAKTLYEKAQASGWDFVLHCDNNTESLNLPQPTAPYARDPTGSGARAPLVNSFCVLSELDGDTRASGVNLNTKAGLPPAPGSLDPVQDDNLPSVLKPFITTLNGSDIEAATDSCDDVVGVRDGSYNRCQHNGESRGAVWYNANASTVIFSKQGSFSPDPSTLDRFLGFFRSIFGGNVPDPLISFTGSKIYVARKGGSSGDTMVQAQLENTPTGTQGVIIYTNIDASGLATTYAAKATLTDLGNGVQSVRLVNPTQGEWEAFTLAIRPS